MSARSAYPSSVVKGIPRLGRKPDGWREVAFGDVLEVVKRPATIDPTQSYQLINVKRNRGGVIPRETKRGREIKTKTQFYVAAEDFVISRRQIVHGACGIVPPELDRALVSNEYSTFVPKNGLCLEFLACFSHTSHFQKTCFHASVGVVIEKMIFNLDAWLKHRFYLPPLKEQERIVRILAAADRAIARTENLIATKRKLKEEIAEQLLTGRCRIPNFKEGWQVVRADEVCEIVIGRTPARKSTSYWATEGSGHPWVTISDLHSRWVTDTNEKITDLGIEKSNAKLIPRGTTLMSFKLTIGKTARAGIDLYTNEAIAAFFANDGKVSQEYLCLALPVAAAAAATDQAIKGVTLNKDKVEGMLLRLPPLSEQAAISAVLEAAERSIELMKKKQEALLQLKKGLMQKLLPSEPHVEAS